MSTSDDLADHRAGSRIYHLEMNILTTRRNNPRQAQPEQRDAIEVSVMSMDNIGMKPLDGALERRSGHTPIEDLADVTTARKPIAIAMNRGRRTAMGSRTRRSKKQNLHAVFDRQSSPGGWKIRDSFGEGLSDLRW